MADINEILSQGIGNALVQGTHAGYYASKTRQEQNAFQGEQAARPDIAAAIGGDQGAQGRVAQASPTTFAHIAPHIAKLDADKRAQAKAAADFTAHATNTLLQADPKDRAAVYQQMIELGKAQGHDMSTLPPQYTPAFDTQARLLRGQSKDLLTLMQQQEMEAGRNARHNSPGGGTPPAMEPMNPAPGPRADAGGPSPTFASATPGSLPPGTFAPSDVAQNTSVAQAPPGAAAAPPPRMAQGSASVAPPPSGEPQVVQGDSPGLTPQVTGPQVATPPGTQPAPAAPPQQGAIWTVDPSTQGAQMMGHRAKPGAPLLPAEIAGHFVYKLPNGQTVLYKPGSNQQHLPQGFEANPDGGLRPIRGGPADPDTVRRLAIPSGYQPGPDGGLAPIAGGPADPNVITRTAESKRIAAEKAVPQTIAKGMQENVDAMKQVDRAIDALNTNPGSVGGAGSVAASMIPGMGNLQNRYGDPQGAQVRALIADIGSLKLHDRSGAAVTASEFPRLRPFIPTIADDPKTVATKLANFRAVYEQTLRDTAEYYGPENGFRPYTPATRYLDGEVGPEKAAPTTQGKSGERPPLESFQK